MIELKSDSLVFRFPEVHEDARLEIDFQRTLRIPDDDNTYALPPGLGKFPLRHVDDFATRVPSRWVEHGGVMLPMYQSEAMWICFGSDWIDDHHTSYPFAVKIAAGKIDAVSGKAWQEGLHRRPQDYVVVPGQPWLDGYNVKKGEIRQFVAMPLGSGYSAEEQLTGTAEHGGLQISVRPMRRDVFERRFPKGRQLRRRGRFSHDVVCLSAPAPAGMDMGLAPGGHMKQDIHRDPNKLKDWETESGSRCFVHLANSLVWRAITGERPPTTPPTAKEYTDAGLPWFDHYDDSLETLEGSERLASLESILQRAARTGDAPLPENESVSPEQVVKIRASTNRVREGRF